MKIVLGFDLGVASIGWALIGVTDNFDPVRIIATGVRRIPIDSAVSNDFSAGKSFTVNQDKTKRKTGRKCYDRYQQRREYLTAELKALGMLPSEELIKLPVYELWNLRGRAAMEGEKLTLPEIGRVLYHINQRRGYKHSKADVSADTKQREYVKMVNSRFDLIHSLGQTIGQYFASKLRETSVQTSQGTFYTYRIKEQVFPRQAYEEEFDLIMHNQQKFYPDILTDERIKYLRNNIIFYQRNLKSCKYLVSLCEFEKAEYTSKYGGKVVAGPKVAAKSNPLFQLDKIWESVNNISLYNKSGDELFITLEQKQQIVSYLNTNEVLKIGQLFKILGVSRKEWSANKSLSKGIKGNITLVGLRKALEGVPNIEDLLRFNLKTVPTSLVDSETGEVIQAIDSDCISEPLYQLWHVIYSVKEKNELKRVLRSKFKIDDEDSLEKLFKLDFTKEGYGNKSVKAIRRILPYLQEGLKYSDACEYAGFRHSGYLTSEENESRPLLDKLPHLEKNELRQPVVEKILNQMINIVNEIIADSRYGRPDVIRVELARVLKMSKDERENISKKQNALEKEKKEYSKNLEEEGIKPTRNILERYRLWNESGKSCFYCQTPIGVSEFVYGSEVETEHIIPKALLFDNSYSNKVCACRKCNKEKGRKTAYDYMDSLGVERLNSYLDFVNGLYAEGKISNTKRERLLTKEKDIPQDFIERDLRLTQYISKKAMELLRQVCRDVTATTGGVTDFIRHTWGYDTLLEKMNFERYKRGELTEWKEYTHRGQKHKKEIIKDWTKRMDHRHHAIDAVVVAMTTPGIIQRLNTLNTSRDAMFKEVEKQSDEWKNDYSLLQQWLYEKKHFSLNELEKSIASLLVSNKTGKKVAGTGTRAVYKNGKRVIVQNKILIPRGPLHDSSVYGKIKIDGKDEIVIRYKLGIGSQGFLFTGKETYKEESKINKKTGLQEIKITDKIKDVLDSIVDANIRRRVLDRLNEGFTEGQDYRNNPKKALDNLKNLEENPVYADEAHTIPVKAIRCKTGLNAVVPINVGDDKKAVGYVKPNNNHHIAIYRDENGKYQELMVTFWQAVERKRYNLPVIIDNPKTLWDDIQDKDIPEELRKTFPEPQWDFVLSLPQHEYFVLEMEENEFQDAIRNNDKTRLNKNLYIVQKLSSMNYCFCLSTAANFDQKKMNKPDRRFLNIRSLDALFKLNPHKVKITLLGDIKI